MKRIGLFCVLCCFLAVSSSCNTPKFNGSSTGNEEQFIMEYSILNTSDTRDMCLNAGDIVDTEIVSESGKVNIQVENSKGDIISSQTDAPTSTFEIVIPQDDTYTFTVTGQGAKGSVSFIRR